MLISFSLIGDIDDGVKMKSPVLFKGLSMKVYRIRNWEKHYENNRTRDMKVLQWIPIPIKLSSYGYSLIMSRENGASIFGAWVACVEVAGRCAPRGTFLRDSGEPHTFETLSLMTRIPESIISLMFSICVEKCKWIEIIEIEKIPQEGAEIPQEGARCLSLNRIEGNRIEKKGIEDKESGVGVADTPLVPISGNPESGKKPKKEKPVFPIDSFEYQFSEKIYKSLTAGTGAIITPAKIQSGASVVDLMLRVDKRDGQWLENTLQAVLIAPERNGFAWHKVIKSPEKFRIQINKGQIHPDINKNSGFGPVNSGFKMRNDNFLDIPEA